MNVKLVLSAAFALSLCVACSGKDSSEPRTSAVETETVETETVETETVEVKGESVVPVKFDPSSLLPDSIRKHSYSYKVERAIERCSEEKEFVLCVCGNVRGLLVFPFNGKKYVCPK